MNAVSTPSVGGQRWAQLAGDAEYIGRVQDAEQYSLWTDPTLFPKEGDASGRIPVATDAIGAQVLNHLANKMADVLFPSSRPYLRLKMPQAVGRIVDTVNKALDSQAIPPDQGQLIKQKAKDLETELNRVEQSVQDDLVIMGYRAQTVPACKHLISSGNVCIWHPETVGPGAYARVIPLRDFVVVRDASGSVLEFMTRLTQAFSTLPDEVRSKLQEEKYKQNPDNNAPTPVYTHGVLTEGKYVIRQYIDQIDLDKEASYPIDKLPWLFLSWDRAYGRKYGTSLVAQFAGAFSGIEAMSQSLRNIGVVVGDIKFFVDPISGIDIAAVNGSATGSYHSGKAESITTPQFNKSQDVQFMLSMIERYTKQLAQSFLLMSAVTRQAERVTAEEIRRDAEELEKSNGGVYSRMAAEWQYPLALVQLDRVGYDPSAYGTTPLIATGMASLSRASDLDNLRMAFVDLAALNTIPEDVRAYLIMDEVLRMIFTGRQVEHSKIIRTDAQVQATKQQEQQAAMQQLELQNQGKVQAEAVKGIGE